PNGINLPKSVQKAEAKTEFCDKFGFDIEIPIILFVANDFEKEGLESFLKILSQLTNKYKNLAKKLGVSVAFMGEQRNISKFYEASDLFLYPVVYEPFGNVVLEAMSYGCAVVTTAQCGASELLSDKYFILKNQNDTNAPKIVNDLLEKPELMNKFGLANIEISHNFTIERNAQLTLKVINAYIH
nr:glycosyltransferase family 4 protein [Campylobacter sp.]